MNSHGSDPAERPLDLEAIQADDALVDQLDTADRTPGGVDDELARALTTWCRGVDAGSKPELIDAEQAAAAIHAARRRPRHRHLLRLVAAFLHRLWRRTRWPHHQEEEKEEVIEQLIDADLLIDVIAEACPDVLTGEAARQTAERALARLARIDGVTVVRGPDSTPWTPEPVVEAHICCEHVR